MHKKSVIMIIPGLERVVQVAHFNLTTQSLQKKTLECVVTYIPLGRGVAFQRTVDAGGWCFSAVANK